MEAHHRAHIKKCTPSHPLCDHYFRLCFWCSCEPILPVISLPSCVVARFDSSLTMKTMSFFSVVVVALLLAQDARVRAQETVTLGLLLPYTGALPIGNDLEVAANLALEDINELDRNKVCDHSNVYMYPQDCVMFFMYLSFFLFVEVRLSRRFV